MEVKTLLPSEMPTGCTFWSGSVSGLKNVRTLCRNNWMESSFFPFGAPLYWGQSRVEKKGIYKLKTKTLNNNNDNDDDDGESATSFITMGPRTFSVDDIILKAYLVTWEGFVAHRISQREIKFQNE
ncbi:hypothetical protein CDAR_245381 [Caerostris darwini]|uniref:Uncharacterized protein n=1 Tax=Caerostris darwini TaxID=1538125 RepID=A0AAV4NZL1_9ARAC|nr:hypothetical protein CDAR_245381 [Caerostris darwini]